MAAARWGRATVSVSTLLEILAGAFEPPGETRRVGEVSTLLEILGLVY